MMLPMVANWRSCSGVALVLAPRSSMWVWPCAAGIAEMIAARSTPGSVFNTKCAMAVSAPVLPALTAAQARRSCTRSIATRIEESFLWRIASRGLSSMVTTCEVATATARSRAAAGSAAGSPRAAAYRLPVKRAAVGRRPAPARHRQRTRAARSRRSSHQSRSAARRPFLGPAQDLRRLFLVLAAGGFLDHALTTVETVRRDAVAQVRLARLRVGGQRRLSPLVVRAAHAACRGRLAAFLNGHRQLLKSL